MYISTTLADQLKQYLKQQADMGSVEAEELLAEFEQADEISSEAVLSALSAGPTEGLGLGC